MKNPFKSKRAKKPEPQADAIEVVNNNTMMSGESGIGTGPTYLTANHPFQPPSPTKIYCSNCDNPRSFQLFLAVIYGQMWKAGERMAMAHIDLHIFDVESLPDEHEIPDMIGKKHRLSDPQRLCLPSATGVGSELRSETTVTAQLYFADEDAWQLMGGQPKVFHIDKVFQCHVRRETDRQILSSASMFCAQTKENKSSSTVTADRPLSGYISVEFEETSKKAIIHPVTEIMFTILPAETTYIGIPYSIGSVMDPFPETPTAPNNTISTSVSATGEINSASRSKAHARRSVSSRDAARRSFEPARPLKATAQKQLAKLDVHLVNENTQMYMRRSELTRTSARTMSNHSSYHKQEGGDRRRRRRHGSTPGSKADLRAGASNYEEVSNYEVDDDEDAGYFNNEYYNIDDLQYCPQSNSDDSNY